MERGLFRCLFYNLINIYLNEALVVLGTAFDHAGEGVGKPFLKVPVRFKDVGHEEMHE